MTTPEFPKLTIDILAKRARFQCSNPDCGAQTVGPNSDPVKATMIGEAAHIMGARPGSARYDPAMSDATRAAITNGVWLCGNCHGQIDRDEAKYPAKLLFEWRKEHEERVARELGSRGDRIRYDTEMASFEFLSKYPAIIQRIAIDKPAGWEWRFTAELMRHLNKPQIKRLRNLQSDQYYNPHPRVARDQFLSWVADRTYVASRLIRPLVSLVDRLKASWGADGEAGDIEEMHDVCVLLQNVLKVGVDFEESVRFVQLPKEGEGIRDILMDSVGPNVARLAELPKKLDEMVAMIGTDHGGTPEAPTIIKWTLTFELSPDFDDRFSDALERFEQEYLAAIQGSCDHHLQ